MGCVSWCVVWRAYNVLLGIFTGGITETIEEAMTSYYTVSVWVPGKKAGDKWHWRCECGRATKWGLRKVLRRIRGLGFVDDCSYLVETKEFHAQRKEYEGE